MSVVENLNEIKKTIPNHVKLVAVSKFHPNDTIMDVYDVGQRVFGESRQQELTDKCNSLPSDIEWHFIGHLQTNKVKHILPCTHIIHSMDSARLLQEIEKQASAIAKPIDCLLEIHIAEEDSKFGLSIDECKHLLDSPLCTNLQYTRIVGVMGMATYTDDQQQVRQEFKKLRNFFNELKNNYFINNDYFREISMGMSHDYQIAIEEGSTMVRIGTSIFGEREY